MKISEMEKEIGFNPLWVGWTDGEILGACTSDLLSDVMAHAEEGQVLFTIQAHKNSVAVAVLKDLAAMVICSNRTIPEDMINAAKKEGLPLFVTEESQYSASWRFYKASGIE